MNTDTPKTLACFRDGKWHSDELANLAAKQETELAAAIQKLSDEQAFRESITREYHDLAVKNREELAVMTRERDKLKELIKSYGHDLGVSNNKRDQALADKATLVEALKIYAKDDFRKQVAEEALRKVGESV